MTPVSWLVFVLYWAVCLGLLRRPFLRHSRFTVPGSLAGWVSFILAGSIPDVSEFWWGPTMVALVVGLGAATSAKQWLDDALGGE